MDKNCVDLLGFDSNFLFKVLRIISCFIWKVIMMQSVDKLSLPMSLFYWVKINHLTNLFNICSIWTFSIVDALPGRFFLYFIQSIACKIFSLNKEKSFCVFFFNMRFNSNRLSLKRCIDFSFLLDLESWRRFFRNAVVPWQNFASIISMSLRDL